MNNRRSTSLAGNPILIGAATVFLSVLGVFLAYNANEGLPFVPKYTLTAQVPSAAALVKGNEVKIGGARVGMVTDIRPKTWPDGKVTALIDMQLDKKVEPIPADSTVEIRPVSPLGLKFVDLHRGTAKDGFGTGATMPLAAATPLPVQIDDLFNMFDKPTRDASNANLVEFGNAIAGRGMALNETIRNLEPLVQKLEPVMKNLSDPKTGLEKLFPSFEQTANQTAPVADQQASLFRVLNTTFTSLAAVTTAIQATITEGPAALDAALSSFPVQQPFLKDSATFFNTLTPGAEALAASSATLQSAAASGADPNGGLALSPALNTRLATLFDSLNTFLVDPNTQAGILRLISTTQAGGPLVSWIAPSQTKCNYWALALRNAGSIASDGYTDGTAGGTFLRAVPIVTANGPNPWSKWNSNAEGGASGSVNPANGKTYAAGPTAEGSYSTNYLHTNSYPYTAAAGEPVNCQAANESFPAANDAGIAKEFTQLGAADALDKSAGTTVDRVRKPGEPATFLNYPYPSSPPWK